MNRRKIIWTYWQNPFGNDDEEYVAEDVANISSPWQESDEEESNNIKIRPVMPTMMGFIPIQPFQSFSKQFQFWMGNTNFNVTQEVKDIIENTPGVEILDIITRYCFRISIGKLFDGMQVKHEIMKNLNALPPKKGEINPTDMKLDKDTELQVSILQHTLKEKFAYWAVYVLPNGEIDIAGANTEEGYEMHMELYKEAQRLAGGIIYQYA